MPKLYVTVTMDWEARILVDDRIRAIEQFRTTFPSIPVTHFLCPAYFSRVATRKASSSLSTMINRTIRQNIDEVALHIHCWYSLIDMALGGRHYTTPTWNYNNSEGGGVPYIPPRSTMDYGHDVPLGCYTQTEIEKILWTGIQLINYSDVVKTGPITSFRCGGWMAADKVMHAIRAVGLKCEASATPGRYFRMVVEPKYPALPLMLWLPLIWAGDHNVALPTYLANGVVQAAYPGGITGLYPDEVTTPISQPTQMNGFKQIPDTAVLADYISLDTLKTHIRAALETSKTKNVFISLGWHDTTANRDSIFTPGMTNINVIAEAIRTIPNGAARFLTVRDAARVQTLLASGLEPPPMEAEVDTQAVMPPVPSAGPGFFET